MRHLPVPSSPPAGPPSLHPNRIALWPIEDGRYGLDLTYHGATGFVDAERAHKMFAGARIACSFRQELGTGWTVRLGPLPREAMLALLDRYVL